MLSFSETNTLGDDVALDGTKAALQKEEIASAQVPTEKKLQFLELPPELRLIIYEPLLKLGDLNILRVSKLVTQEATPLLSKHAVFRVNVGHRNITSVKLDLTASITMLGHSTLIAPDYIQHVTFRIDMVRFRGWGIDLKFVNYFGGKKIARKSCAITIFVDDWAHLPHSVERDKTYRAIANLTGFEVLLLGLECQKNAQEVAAILSRYGPRVVRIGGMMTGRFMLKSYGRVLGFLQTTLGPADFKEDIHQHSLVFRPSQYKIGD